MIRQKMDRIPTAIFLFTIMVMCLTWAAGQEAEKTESTIAQAREETVESSRLTELSTLRTEASALRTEAQQQGGQQQGGQQPGAQPAGGADAQNGTDPRDMSSKFMPFYRHTKLENEIFQNEFVIFGIMALTRTWGLLYEFPLSFHRDITGTPNCAGLPTIPCFGTIPGGGATLPNGLPAEGDGKEVGVGDGNVKIFGGVGHALGGDWMTGLEFGLPLATDPVIGSETATLAPMLVYVTDLPFWPGPAFFASMNFYKFDIWKDAGRQAIRQYIGRWFLMLPLHPSGIYTLPEFQLVYDWKAKNFSVLIAPEFGKMVAPGQIMYFKPGWGIKNSLEADRNYSVEVGFRWFLQ